MEKKKQNPKRSKEKRKVKRNGLQGRLRETRDKPKFEANNSEELTVLINLLNKYE